MFPAAKREGKAQGSHSLRQSFSLALVIRCAPFSSKQSIAPACDSEPEAYPLRA
jgi:hypothetical protein